MSNPPIYVTRPFLPPLADLVPMLEDIWQSRILSNHGPFHQKFESALTAFLDVNHVSLTANGMLALEAAIEAADLSGEVVTTPYSFVATTHAVRRANLEPVFVDVRAADLNIDPDAIEAAITDRTTAIVAVHCYGTPCEVDTLAEIAVRRGLKLIYDAAHAFGVRLNGESILRHGDFSTLSFHATKAFNTFEGGAVVAATDVGKATIDSLRNFGIASETAVPNTGGNAKMSEFNAALGILQLKRFEDTRAARRLVDARYREALSDVAGIALLDVAPGVEPNFSYFPILVREDYPLSRDALYVSLKTQGIFARRYFYPLLSNLPMYHDLPSADRANLPEANRAAEEILCLPIYPDLSEGDQDRIIAEILRAGLP